MNSTFLFAIARSLRCVRMEMLSLCVDDVHSDHDHVCDATLHGRIVHSDASPEKSRGFEPVWAALRPSGV